MSFEYSIFRHFYVKDEIICYSVTKSKDIRSDITDKFDFIVNIYIFGWLTRQGSGTVSKTDCPLDVDGFRLLNQPPIFMKMHDIMKLAATPENLERGGKLHHVKKIELPPKRKEFVLPTHCRLVSGAEINYKTPHVDMSTCIWK